MNAKQIIIHPDEALYSIGRNYEFVIDNRLHQWGYIAGFRE